MKELPYIKGRWYRALVESNNSAITIKTIDGPIKTSSISGGKLKLPAKFRLVDYKIDIDTTEISGVTAVNTGINKYADGTLAITLPDPTLFDAAHVYIFGYFN